MIDYNQDTPALENVADIASAIADFPEPQITTPEDDVVQLPCGLVFKGEIIRTARVRELTGADEEKIARASLSSRQDAFIETLLECGVTHVGSRAATEDSLLDRLVVGDRDTLLIGIRRATYGNDVEYDRYRCSGCQVDFRVRVGLDEIPIKRAENPGQIEFDVNLRKGAVARVRMVRGIDQAELLKANSGGSMTVSELNTVLFSRVVININDPVKGQRAVMGNMREVRDLMSMADRAAILKALAENRYGPTGKGVPVNCPSCGADQEVVVGIDDMFRH